MPDLNPFPARRRSVRFVNAADQAPTASPLPTSPHSRATPAISLMSPPPRHSRPLYACKELPAVDTDAELHPILRINLDSSAELFDVLRDPSHQLPAPSALGEAATHPPRPCMALICPRLPWRIEIENAIGGFVSAADVRAGIHDALAAPVTRAELLATPVLDRPIISMAFNARCERAGREFGPGAAQGEMQRGIRRVDFLFGSNRFVGLSVIPEMPDVWEMVFSS